MNSPVLSRMITLKNTHIVKPADSTQNEIICVKDFDQVRPITHAPLIYFYRPTRESVQDAIHILKDSLSKALVIFYPFAGRLHWIGGGRVELHCNSMGALLLEAETKLKIDDFGDFRPTPEITALLPYVDFDATPIQEIPLLLIQLTRFACGGLGLGMKLSHTLADGKSALHFVAEWTKIARGKKSIDLPSFDRKVLQPREPLVGLPRMKNSLNPPPLLIGHSDNREERNKPTTVIMLKLDKEQIEKLKNKANQTIEADRHSTFHRFTRFEAVSGHIWRCASKARRHASEQETACYVTVDIRNRRLKQSLPPRYFGNAVLFIPAIATAGDLISKPLGYAAAKIREAINFVTDEYVNSYLVTIKNLSDVSSYRHFHIVGHSQGAFLGNPNLAITSWIGLPLYGVDFGWGEEFFMGPGSLGYDGRGFFIPSHGGDGSFFTPLRLQVEHVDAFQKNFYEEIDSNSFSARL